jgi:predicted ester cyclase
MPTPREALSTALESWNAGDLDSYLALYRDDIRLHGYSPEPMGKDQVRAFYEGVMAAFDSPKLEVHESLWDGDSCVLRFTMSGRHVGEFMGVPPTDAPIAQTGITILHFEGDQVRERYSQADMLGLLVQIGAMPAPA